MLTLFVPVLESGCGPKQTLNVGPAMSALEGRANIKALLVHVRF